MLVLMPFQLLASGVVPVESQPDWLPPIMFLFPSRHYGSFSQAIAFRGADFAIMWPEFVLVAGLGLDFFLASLSLSRRWIARST